MIASATLPSGEIFANPQGDPGMSSLTMLLIPGLNITVTLNALTVRRKAFKVYQDAAVRQVMLRGEEAPPAFLKELYLEAQSQVNLTEDEFYEGLAGGDIIERVGN